MILIGTDSKAFRGYIRYCTAILDTETGRLEKHYTTTKLMPRQARLHQEAAITIGWSTLFNPEDRELHFDFSPNPIHKSYPVYAAYKGLGKFKPEAFMATAVADYFLEH